MHPPCLKQFVPLQLLIATMTRDRPKALDNLSGLALGRRPGSGSWMPTRLNRKGRRKEPGADLRDGGLKDHLQQKLHTNQKESRDITEVMSRCNQLAFPLKVTAIL